MLSRQHALMKDPSDENPVVLAALENRVPALFDATIPGRDLSQARPMSGDAATSRIHC
jgi:hypothetical protein